MQKNAGNLDAFLRTLLGFFIGYYGLAELDGFEGDLTGLLVALVSLVPFYMVITRKYFVFKYFNISSVPKGKRQ